MTQCTLVSSQWPETGAPCATHMSEDQGRGFGFSKKGPRNPTGQRMPVCSTRLSCLILLLRPPISPPNPHHGWIWAAICTMGAIAALEHSERDLRINHQISRRNRDRSEGFENRRIGRIGKQCDVQKMYIVGHCGFDGFGMHAIRGHSGIVAAHYACPLTHASGGLLKRAWAACTRLPACARPCSSIVSPLVASSRAWPLMLSCDILFFVASPFICRSS